MKTKTSIRRAAHVAFAGLAAALVLSTCDSPPTGVGDAGLLVSIVSAGGLPLASVDEGRIHIEGPTNRTLTVTPGVQQTIEGLLPGKYTVALEGVTAGAVETWGEATNVTVTAGSNTPVTVSMSSFIPTLNSVPAKAVANQAFTVTFTPVTGAESYVIEWANNAGFSGAQSTTTSSTAASLTIASSGSLFLRVKAKDRFGTLGIASASEPLHVASDVARLIHQYRFDESGGAGTTLVDAVGGANATIVDVGSRNATATGGKVYLAGGDRAQADYVALPDNVLAGLTDASIEIWGTQLYPESWGRIFDFGGSDTDYLMMAWTYGNDINVDRVEWATSAGTGGLVRRDATMSPYVLGREYHIVLTVEFDGNVTSHVRVYLNGQLRTEFDAPFDLTKLPTTNMWLGRSQFAADATARASYDELRIYDGVLTAAQVTSDYQAGPTASPTGGAKPTFGLYGTGVDDDGNLLGPKLDDPHYTIFAQPAPGGLTEITVPADGTTPGEDDSNDYPIPPWPANTATARWIGPLNNSVEEDALGPAGSFTYRTTFTIPGGVELSALQIQGVWMADDGGTDVRINGVSIAPAQLPSLGAPAAPFVVTGPFVTGVNTLDFVVGNGGGPTGLFVDGITVGYGTGPQSAVVLTPVMARLGYPGAEVTLLADQLDGNGNPVSGVPISWASSNDNVAYVLHNGSAHDAFVAAIAPGTVTMTASDGAHTAAMQVMVDNVFTNLVLWNGHVYGVTTAPMTWEAARDFAALYGGHLVTVQDGTESAFVDNYYPQGWLGLSDIAQEGTFEWVDDSPVGFTNWRAGEPDNAGDEDCTENTANGWNDRMCVDHTFAIVEWDFGVRLSYAQVSYYGGHRYARTATPMTWTQARDLAGALGGHLVKIGSAAENDFLAATYPPSGVNYWIGLNDRATEGTFVWVDGTGPGYTNWEAGEPNNNGGEDCAHFWAGHGGKWNDSTCGTSVINLDTTPMYGIIEWDADFAPGAGRALPGAGAAGLRKGGR